MDYDTPEERYNLKHPLISLNAGKQNDFVKALFFKLALKGAKIQIYQLKEEIKKLRKKEENQTIEINRLKELNHKLKHRKRNGRN